MVTNMRRDWFCSAVLDVRLLESAFNLPMDSVKRIQACACIKIPVTSNLNRS